MIDPEMRARQGPTAAGALGTRLPMPVVILILAAGVRLVLEHEGHGFMSNFISIGSAMVVVGALLGILVIIPAIGAAAQAVESGDASIIKSASGRRSDLGVGDRLLLPFVIAAIVLRLEA